MNDVAMAVPPVRNPWIFKRQVKWGECDPAGVVYTPRFADFVTEAHLAFFHHLFGVAPFEILLKDQLALPARAISIEFKKPLWPNEWFDIEVSIADIRSRTYDLGMTARALDGAELFTASFTLICLDRQARKAVPLPAFLRDKLVTHRGGQSIAPENASA